MSDSVISQFGLTASDGENVAVVDWSLPEGQSPRAVVLIAHGLGEHSWRYAHVAIQLNEWGFAVRAMDWYGHGESGGPRGGLPNDHRMLDDLAELVDDTRRVWGEKMPVILLGHSMGGLIAADFVRQKVRPLHALVLSSPALEPGLSLVQRLLLAIVPKIAPNFRVANGLKPEFISHDPEVVKAYVNDKLVHNKISARLGLYIAVTGPKVVEAAATWTTPTLLLYAGDDKLVKPCGSKSFLSLAKAAKNADVEGECFAAMYHEIFNEPDRAKVFAVLGHWLAKLQAKQHQPAKVR